jgi:hypothetical protein
MRQVVLQLPDELWERKPSAAQADQPLESYLVEELARNGGMEHGSKVAGWDQLDLSGLTDAQLRIHIRATLPGDAQQRLSELRSRNAEVRLTGHGDG